MAKKKVRSTVTQTGARPGDIIEVEDDENTRAKIASGFFIEVTASGKAKAAPAPAAEASAPAPSGDSKPSK